MNILSKSLWTYGFISLRQIGRSGIAGLYGNFMFNFFEKLPNCFSKGATLFYILASKVGRFSTDFKDIYFVCD